MEKIGIFYGSTTGITEYIAEDIKDEFGKNVDIYNVYYGESNKLNEYKNLILGCSTWGPDELQDDWQEFIFKLNSIDFKGKKVAIFGIGDQVNFPKNFVDGIGIVYNSVKERGGTVIGFWPVNGYKFEKSSAILNGKFVGLAIDEDNQANFTSDRIKKWVEDLKKEFF